MGSLPTNAQVRSIAVNPLAPQLVYVAGPAGLFRSEDSGLTWTAAGSGLAGEPLAVTLNPAAPLTVITVLLDGSVWKSTDGATSWSRVGVGS